MVTRHRLLIGWLALLTWCGPAGAATIPTPLMGVVVSATVTKDPSAGIFTYRYRVINPASNDGAIRSLAIELTRSAGDVALGNTGLVNGPGYLAFGSADTFAQVPMVPVGMSGPDGWLQSLEIHYGHPRRGWAGWGSSDEPFRVAPARSQDGYELTSYGLPGLRPAEIEPAIDLNALPDEYFGNVELSVALQEGLVFHTKTVGPKAPPATFVPLEFLNYLIALLHDSRQQGWVTVDGIHQSLLAKLLAAKRSLEAGRTQPAKGQLNAFLNEVQAVSCPQFSCPGNKPLTSEAYALLYFNGQFLAERLQ